MNLQHAQEPQTDIDPRHKRRDGWTGVVDCETLETIQVADIRASRVFWEAKP